MIACQICHRIFKGRYAWDRLLGHYDGAHENIKLEVSFGVVTGTTDPRYNKRFDESVEGTLSQAAYKKQKEDDE